MNPEKFVSEKPKETRVGSWEIATRVPVLGSLVLAAALGVATLKSNIISAQEVSCDPYISYNSDRLILASDCLGQIWDFTLTPEQVAASGQPNDLTTNLSQIGDQTPYEWLNIPFEELIRDEVSKLRKMTDQRFLELFQGQTNTDEGTARMAVLRDRIRDDLAASLGRNPEDIKVDWPNFQLLYWDNRRNTIGDLTQDNLHWLGVPSDQINSSGIGFSDDGSPATINEWQTRTSPLRVEDDREGVITVSRDPNAFTRAGVRSANAPEPAIIGPILDAEGSNVISFAVVNSDGSCGNIITKFALPFKEFKAVTAPTPTGEIIVILFPTSKPAPTFNVTETPTPTETPRIFYGGSGGGYIVYFVPTPTPGETAVPFPTASPVPTNVGRSLPTATQRVVTATSLPFPTATSVGH